MKIIKTNILMLVFSLLYFTSCGQQEHEPKTTKIFQKMEQAEKNNTKNIDTITIGGGCFWCTEAQLLQLKGVLASVSGYAGGSSENPTYKEVCMGYSGHAEVIQVTFDPSIISYDEMLSAFWQAHDPTQLNRQGADEGTQYRSVIFYHNEQQKQLAEAYKKKLNEEKVYDKDIVTEISPLTKFYKAEAYHQDYYNNNKTQGYCSFVIAPKLDKFKKVFKDKLK
jgi:peptide-methionine (S)-S-oxide reductase